MDTVQTQVTGAKRLPVTGRQTVALLVLGAILWFIAATLLRLLGPVGIYEGIGRVINYALIFPGLLPFLLVAFKISGLEKSQYFTGVGLMTLSAALLDGIALAWFPGLYGNTPEMLAGAGSTILWGVGAGFVLAYFMNRAD